MSRIALGEPCLNLLEVSRDLAHRLQLGPDPGDDRAHQRGGANQQVEDLGPDRAGRRRQLRVDPLEDGAGGDDRSDEGADDRQGQRRARHG